MQILVKLAPAATRRWKSSADRLATVSVVPMEDAPDTFIPWANRAVRVGEMIDGLRLQDLPPISLRIEAVMPGGARLEQQVSPGSRAVEQQVILRNRLERPMSRRRGTARQGVSTSGRPDASRARGIGDPSAVLRLLETEDELIPADFLDGSITVEEIEQLGLGTGFIERTMSVLQATARYDTAVVDLVLGQTYSTNDRDMLRAVRGGVSQRGWWRHVDFFAPFHMEDDPYVTNPRRYAVLATERAAYAVPLLHAQLSPESSELRLRANARIRLAEGREVDPLIEVTSTDSMMSSVLDLLQHGEIAAAKGVIDAASELLFQKLHNPYLAVLGAHVLLGTGDIRRSMPWHGWVQNLADFFPDIPDGMIVLAALVLRRAAGLRDPYHRASISEAMRNAKVLCGFAMRKGPPHFVASIRLLAENLSLIASYEYGHDPIWRNYSTEYNVDELLRSVQWLGAHTDATQGFTVLKLQREELELAQRVH